MLKRLIKLVGKQRLIPWVGEFKETLSQVIFWGSMVNWVMVAGTFYYTTLRHVLPWFRLGLFVGLVGVGMVVIFVLEFKFVVPSIWAFRGKQMDLRNAVPKEEGAPTVARRVTDERRDSYIARVSRRRSHRKGYRRY